MIPGISLNLPRGLFKTPRDEYERLKNFLDKQKKAYYYRKQAKYQKVTTKRSTHVTPKENEIHRLKDLPGTYMRKVALEPESRTRTGCEQVILIPVRKVGFHGWSPLQDKRDIWEIRSCSFI